MHRAVPGSGSASQAGQGGRRNLGGGGAIRLELCLTTHPLPSFWVLLLASCSFSPFLNKHFIVVCSCPNFPPPPLLSSPAPPSPAPTDESQPAVRVRGSFIPVPRPVPSPSFHPHPPPASARVAAGLFLGPMPLVLFCLLILLLRFFLEVRSQGICLAA